MKQEEFTKELAKQLGCEFVHVGGKVEHHWDRIFVLNSKGVTIGKITFKDGELYYLKSYKKDYRRDLCETDQIFFRLERYIQDNTIVSLEKYRQLIKVAQLIVAKDKQNKINWRRKHPRSNRPRKRLIGKNIRFVLRTLINYVQVNEDEFENSIKTIIKDIYMMKGLFERL